MKRVTLARDIRPWRAGQQRVVPDAVATRLLEDGLAENPRPFPEPAPGERPAPAKLSKTKGKTA